MYSSTRVSKVSLSLHIGCRPIFFHGAEKEKARKSVYLCLSAIYYGRRLN